MEYSCTTADAKVYQLRSIKNGDDYCSWADITVRGWDGGGTIDIQSDYGSYAYGWHHTGNKNFLEFLLKLDFHYFMGKCKMQEGGGYTFDPTASVKDIYSEIVRWRKENGLSKEKARELWNLVNESELDSADTIQDIYEYIPPEVFSTIYYNDPTALPSNQCEDPGCKFFWSTAWQAACEVWRKELEEAANAFLFNGAMVRYE